jgi:hypothetical protein
MGDSEAGNMVGADVGVAAGDRAGDGEADGRRDGFLARWSRRKSLSRRESDVSDPAPAPVPTMGADAMPTPADVETDAEPERCLTDADMPPLESLGPDSDYSGFLSRGVSEALRRKALARLFRSPAYNVTDGLDDYAEDFTKFAPLGELVTSDMRHQIEQRVKRLAESGTDTGAGVDDDGATEPLSAGDADRPDAPDQPALLNPLDPPDQATQPNQLDEHATSATPEQAENRHPGDTQ